MNRLGRSNRYRTPRSTVSESVFDFLERMSKSTMNDVLTDRACMETRRTNRAGTGRHGRSSTGNRGAGWARRPTLSCCVRRTGGQNLQHRCSLRRPSWTKEGARSTTADYPTRAPTRNLPEFDSISQLESRLSARRSSSSSRTKTTSIRREPRDTGAVHREHTRIPGASTPPSSQYQWLYLGSQVPSRTSVAGSEDRSQVYCLRATDRPQATPGP